MHCVFSFFTQVSVISVISSLVDFDFFRELLRIKSELMRINIAFSGIVFLVLDVMGKQF